MRHVFRISARQVALALLLIGVAVAQVGDQAVLNAVKYRPIPADQPIHVRSLDDSRENLRLKRRFEQALRERGFRIGAEPSRLVLTLESSDQLGFWSYSGGALINAQRGFSELAEKDLDSYVLNLYDSRRGGLTNQPERPVGINPSKYRLEARLDDRSDGRTLWQGWTTADVGRSGGSALLEAMVPPLASSLGETVREQPVTLR